MARRLAGAVLALTGLGVAACAPGAGRPTTAFELAPRAGAGAEPGDTCAPQVTLFISAADLLGAARPAPATTPAALAAEIAAENAAIDRLRVAFDGLRYCRWSEVRLIRTEAREGRLPAPQARERLAAAGARFRREVARAAELRSQVAARAPRQEAAVQAARPGVRITAAAARPEDSAARVIVTASVPLRREPTPTAREIAQLRPGQEASVTSAADGFVLAVTGAARGYARGDAFAVREDVRAGGDLRTLLASNIAKREAFAEAVTLAEPLPKPSSSGRCSQAHPAGMTFLLQAAPLVLLLGLLASGRVGPVPACLAALAAALPAASVSLPAGTDLLHFLRAETPRALFLGAQPVAVLAGGLLFSVAAAPSAAAPAALTPRAAYVRAILAGSFVESVTGFAVGAVVALSALRGGGLPGPAAGALALLSLNLVPWGGLGPGTGLAAAVTGIPVAELSWNTALPHAAWFLALLPVTWAVLTRSGVPVPARERAAQAAMHAAVAALLLVSARFLPFEVVGIVATGPVLLLALWRLDPPRDAAAWRRAAAALGPWVVLTACLLLARTWHGAPSWRPYPDLPPVPLTHVAAVLWAVSLALLASRADGWSRLRGALPRLRRPAAAMLLYVLLGRWLAGAGVAAALATALAAALGPLAPYAVPVLGLLAGVVTGSNVGSVAALMPVQQGLGAAAGLPTVLAPAIHNFAGSVGAPASFAATALVCGLLADGTRPADLWRRMAPSLAAALLVGWAAIALLR
ncbi:L-lactate permease [Roseomonas sp. CCTCC AB2023176]|uniref:L-lactate permease n=1 Tax=Roseomonas sp. CCTCC AB2023176 TaxID=3342640 RepID=UPI0035D877EA